MNRLINCRSVAIVACFLIASACSSNSSTGNTTTPTNTLVKIAGDTQTILADATVPVQPSVELVDASGVRSPGKA